jgi:hypothetical protein
MSNGAGAGGAEIRPNVSAIREAQGFLAKYFAATRLIAAPYLREQTRKRGVVQFPIAALIGS